jgi:hypothetical protein
MADVSTDGNARDVYEWVMDSRRIAAQNEMNFLGNTFQSNATIRVLVVASLLLTLSLAASAHNGPPFPIIENKNVGPCVVALWTHPDVGTGAFYVFVEPAPGGSIPSDLKIKIGVQPASGRLPEAFYNADRVESRGQVQYNAQANFDRQELWRVHLVIESAQGGGEATTQVEVTPPGFGRWDLLLYLLPFLFVALLWFRGVSRARRRRNAQAEKPNDSSAVEMIAKANHGI